MITCKNCQHENPQGAVVCADCGTDLDSEETNFTPGINDTQELTDEQIKELRELLPHDGSLICKHCGWGNVSGTLFCVECGAQLDGIETLTTQAVTQDYILQELMLRKSVVESPPSPPANSWITLHFMDSGKIRPLAPRNEYILGRLSEGKTIAPDIDLIPYQAYASGVSRMHAVIKRESNRVVITDLDSSNGTYLNGRRLTPHTEEDLIHGDVVALAKLRIQILLRNIRHS